MNASIIQSGKSFFYFGFRLPPRFRCITSAGASDISPSAALSVGAGGRHNGVVIPSCAVLRIREEFPDPADQYVGFRCPLTEA
ncbi:hypothetical protein F2P81_021761 [Scophthalmus maximus]|uniref:P2X purinoreceptor 7 intracellular domain-containing protein n=1 Tax=Scophthalmus maximus TaxID=52904 RepID=A0A6A4RZT2_SCOMX|nr:hypothetical protein F2P81_021761 [Scophthalmus maximus]